MALAEFWAEHGYICLMPTHGDSPRLRGLTTLDESQREQAIQASVYDWKNWQERPADVSFLLDSLADLEQEVPALEGRIDRLRVGMAGFSLGGHTEHYFQLTRTAC